MATNTATSSDWFCIAVAAMTLVKAIIDPIDRSIPPAMTTTAWAAAASPNGTHEINRPCTPAAL